MHSKFSVFFLAVKISQDASLHRQSEYGKIYAIKTKGFIIMKTKEKITLIRRETVENEGLIYKYELHMKERSRGTSTASLYLISIELTLDDGSVTYAETGEVFADVGKAIAFFDRMVENLATPIDLPYVLEDEIRR